MELLQAEMSFYSVLHRRYWARAIGAETKEAAGELATKETESRLEWRNCSTEVGSSTQKQKANQSCGLIERRGEK